MEISSLQNPLIKEIDKLLQKSSLRREKGIFVTEGVREVSMALSAGFVLRNLLICDELYRVNEVYPINFELFKPRVINVTTSVYSKIAYRGDTEGVLGVFEARTTNLESMKLGNTPLLIVLESVEKPGNLGAILRTADAAGVDAVVICDALTDPYNPNVIRSSLGCIFSVQVVVCSTNEYLNWSARKGINNMLASVQASKPYFNADLTNALALVFGTEKDGLSDIWYHNTTHRLKIPMAGKIDSLNVSASVSAMVFEAVRQRLGNELTK